MSDERVSTVPAHDTLREDRVAVLDPLPDGVADLVPDLVRWSARDDAPVDPTPGLTAVRRFPTFQERPVIVLVGLILVGMVLGGFFTWSRVSLANATPPPTTAVVTTTTVAAPPAPPSTTVRLSEPAVSAAQTRGVFLQSMEVLKLSPAQAECVAAKLEGAMSWDDYRSSSMDPERQKQVTDWVVACVRG